MPPPRRNKRQPHGIAILEFLLVAPILLLLMLAVAELGRALYQYNTLTKAVYAGARYYAANVLVNQGAAETTAINLIRCGTESGSCAYGLLPGSPPDVTINPYNPRGDVRSTMWTVSAAYTFNLLPGNPLGGMLTLLWEAGILQNSSIVLTSTVVVRAL